MAVKIGSRKETDEQGTKEADLMIGSKGSDFLFGDDGNDLLFGGNGSDILIGGAGNDILIGWNGDNLLRGGEGDDHIVSGYGKDTMFGDEGNDTFIMGIGDIATGGADADTFHFNTWRKGAVTITDFNPEEDTLVMSGAKWRDWEIRDDGDAAAIVFETGMEVHLHGVSAEEILADPGLFGL